MDAVTSIVGNDVIQMETERQSVNNDVRLMDTVTPGC